MKEGFGPWDFVSSKGELGQNGADGVAVAEVGLQLGHQGLGDEDCTHFSGFGPGQYSYYRARGGHWKDYSGLVGVDPCCDGRNPAVRVWGFGGREGLSFDCFWSQPAGRFYYQVAGFVVEQLVLLVCPCIQRCCGDCCYGRCTR